MQSSSLLHCFSSLKNIPYIHKEIIWKIYTSPKNRKIESQTKIITFASNKQCTSVAAGLFSQLCLFSLLHSMCFWEENRLQMAETNTQWLQDASQPDRWATRTTWVQQKHTPSYNADWFTQPVTAPPTQPTRESCLCFRNPLKHSANAADVRPLMPFMREYLL